VERVLRGHDLARSTASVLLDGVDKAPGSPPPTRLAKPIKVIPQSRFLAKRKRRTESTLRPVGRRANHCHRVGKSACRLLESTGVTKSARQNACRGGKHGLMLSREKANLYGSVNFTLHQVIES
jgi:hypothetical protein